MRSCLRYALVPLCLAALLLPWAPHATILSSARSKAAAWALPAGTDVPPALPGPSARRGQPRETRAPGRLFTRPALLPVTVSSSLLSATVAPDGAYTVTARAPGWTFAGRLGALLRGLAVAAGTDAVGAYRAITFQTTAGPATGQPATGASIRVYRDTPVAIFSVTYLADTANPTVAEGRPPRSGTPPPSGSPLPFPTFATYPRTPYHLSYDGKFAAVRFALTGADSPWLFFDRHANTAILSPASDFLVSATRLAGGAITTGIDSGIARLPRGLTHRTILVVDDGIGRALTTWGHALTALGGKRRPANDADTGLRTLGYWTDHGAAYYYAYDHARGYTGTLLAVRDEFTRLGLPLGYMELDSWWYPKGPRASWADLPDGAYTYTAAPQVFPQGLPAFRRQLGVPLVVHGRWIAPQSPYRARYAMSGNVSIDPRFWTALMGYLKEAGAITYEQDWLAGPAIAANTLGDGAAYLGAMARAAQAQGLNLQYCTPLPGDYLQSTLYDAVDTLRVSDDRFDRSKWTQFLYGSQLVGALGAWPWSDVFASGERDNLRLATLSAGMVGVGDLLGTVDRANLLTAVRADGVIVKPDAPLVPTDATYLADGSTALGAASGGATPAGATPAGAAPASGATGSATGNARGTGAAGGTPPMVAATYSDHGGMRAAYIFAYPRGAQTAASFVPAALGLGGTVYVYNPDTGHGHLRAASAPVGLTVARPVYEIVVPVGRSGIAFLGDQGKLVSLGAQRIAALRDDGVLQVSVTFARQERLVTLHGYAPRAPVVTATAGSHGPVVYDATSRQFHVTVSPAAGGRATLRLALPGH